MKQMFKAKSIWLVVILVLLVSFISSGQEKIVAGDNDLNSNLKTKITQ